MLPKLVADGHWARLCKVVERRSVIGDADIF